MRFFRCRRDGQVLQQIAMGSGHHLAVLLPPVTRHQTRLNRLDQMLGQTESEWDRCTESHRLLFSMHLWFRSLIVSVALARHSVLVRGL